MVVYSRWCGNSSVISNIAELNAVYPRWRRELTNAAHQGVSSSGLSPLARGTRHMPDHMCSNGRFIPAGAGTLPLVSCRPRKIGLSPLAQGTHILIGIHELRPRFIPAGAGTLFQLQHCCCIDGLSPLARELLIRSSYSAPLAVYPRWRGELSTAGHMKYLLLGLSPLAREL